LKDPFYPTTTTYAPYLTFYTQNWFNLKYGSIDDNNKCRLNLIGLHSLIKVSISACTPNTVQYTLFMKAYIPKQQKPASLVYENYSYMRATY
jgi:hypothetical protein